jgi:hypothetical protein
VARVLVLDAGSFLVSEHVQNLSKIGLNTGGAVQVASNTQDPGVVWGLPWRSQVPFPGLVLVPYTRLGAQRLLATSPHIREVSRKK